MKIVNGFTLRPFGKQYILLGESVEQVNFNKMLRMNETAAYLWQELDGKEFAVEDMANLLCQEYEVEHAQALADAEVLAQEWLTLGIVTE